MVVIGSLFNDLARCETFVRLNMNFPKNEIFLFITEASLKANICQCVVFEHSALKDFACTLLETVYDHDHCVSQRTNNK